MRRCLDHPESNAWAPLVLEIQPLMTRVVWRVASDWGGAQPDEIEDVVQSAFLKLAASNGEGLRRIQAECDESALAYIRRTAAHTALDHFKTKYAGKRSPDQTVSMEGGPDPIAVFGSNRETERAILLQQIDAVLRADQKERAIFWLYYRQGFTAKEIARIPAAGLTESGVESLIRRLTLQAKEDMRDPPKENAGERRPAR